MQKQHGGDFNHGIISVPCQKHAYFTQVVSSPAEVLGISKIVRIYTHHLYLTIHKPSAFCTQTVFTMMLSVC